MEVVKFGEVETEVLTHLAKNKSQNTQAIGIALGKKKTAYVNRSILTLLEKNMIIQKGVYNPPRGRPAPLYKLGESGAIYSLFFLSTIDSKTVIENYSIDYPILNKIIKFIKIFEDVLGAEKWGVIRTQAMVRLGKALMLYLEAGYSQDQAAGLLMGVFALELESQKLTKYELRELSKRFKKIMPEMKKMSLYLRYEGA